MAMRSWLLILAGLSLSILGWLMPLMMVTHLLRSTLFLNFASFTASMAGIILGILGGSLYVRQHRPSHPER